MLATPGAEDPLHMIRELFNWTPLRTLGAPLAPPVFAPLFEVRETKDRYVFKADMPGVKEPDLEVNVTGNRLSIIGVRENEVYEETETIFFEERAFGSFTRQFVLPEGADIEHIQAALKDGVLTVVIPKLPEVKARKIALETGGKVKA
jgi:HSP20 family protein